MISPVLSNLFMHYAYDKWMERTFPNIPFCRYADDGLAHCRTRAEAENMMMALGKRLQECGLEMHPDKTMIVYCKDDDRTVDYAIISFDFLGYTFRPGRSKNRWGKFFINFSPAISAKAGKAIRQEVRRWKLHLRSDKSLRDLAYMFRANIQGWINYYGRFYKSAMYPTLQTLISIAREINSVVRGWIQYYGRFMRSEVRSAVQNIDAYLMLGHGQIQALTWS